MSLSSLFLLQLCTRLLSTILTQLLVRLTPPREFAASHIHLDLVLSTVLFLSREGVRGALLRSTPPLHPPASATVHTHTQLAEASSSDAPMQQRRAKVVALQERSRQNIALLPLYSSIFILPLIYYAYPTFLAPSSLLALPHFKIALLGYLAGAALELLAEPLYTRALSGRMSAQQDGPAAEHSSKPPSAVKHDDAEHDEGEKEKEEDRAWKDTPISSAPNLKLRIRSEGAAVLSRCVITTLVVFVTSRSSTPSSASSTSTLVAFALGQTAYGAAVLLVHLVWFLQHWGFNSTLSLYTLTRSPLLLPSVRRGTKPTADSQGQEGQTPECAEWFDTHTLALVRAMTRQSLVKHALTEADRFAITRIGAGLDQQGAYALASNFGSLFARLVFQPIEESSRLVFAQSGTKKEASICDRRDSSADADADADAHHLLTSLLQIYSTLLPILCIFAQAYSIPVLLVLAGPTWALRTDAPSILCTYASLYLPLMAFNGMLEAYLQSSASPLRIQKYDRVLLLAWTAFGTTLWALPRLTQGAVGLAFWRVRTRMEMKEDATVHVQSSSSSSSATHLILASSVAAAIRAAYCYHYAFARRRTTVTLASELQNDGKRKEVTMQDSRQGVGPRWSTISIYILVAGIVRASYFTLDLNTLEGLAGFDNAASRVRVREGRAGGGRGGVRVLLGLLGEKSMSRHVALGVMMLALLAVAIARLEGARLATSLRTLRRIG